MPTTMTLKHPAVIAAATHPVRAAILDEMRRPSTAAAVARRIGHSRQNVAYHVRELEKAGLLRHLGQRQNANFMEQTYVAAADTIVISPTATWGDPHARTQAMADQLSLGELIAAGGRLQRDSARLLDRAAFDGAEIPSASVTTEIHFASEDARAAFLRDAVAAITRLAHEHGSADGDLYRLLLAAYPDPSQT